MMPQEDIPDTLFYRLATRLFLSPVSCLWSAAAASNGPVSEALLSSYVAAGGGWIPREETGDNDDDGEGNGA